MKTVRDVMRRDIEVLRTTESAADAACYLAARDEDSIPLCLADGSLAGTVSNRDIVAKVVAKGLDPRQVSLAELADPGDVLGLDVDARRRRRDVPHAPAPAASVAGDGGQPRDRHGDPTRRRPEPQPSARRGTTPSPLDSGPGPDETTAVSAPTESAADVPALHTGDLARRIARRRTELGLSVEEVAAKAGIDPDYLRYFEESAGGRLSVGTMLLLALALQSSPEELYGARIDRPPGRGRAGRHPELRELSEDQCGAHLAAGGVGRVVFLAPRGPSRTRSTSRSARVTCS